MVVPSSAQATVSAASDRFDCAAIGVPVYGEPFAVTEESIAAYRAAIGGRAGTDAREAPAIYVCVPAWRTAWDAMARFDRNLTGASLDGLGLHESHAMRFGRPIVPGMFLTTRSFVHAVRASNRGTTVHLTTETFDADGTFVASQHSTSFFRSETGDASIGETLPDGEPVAASVYREEPQFSGERVLDAEQGVRYADASGDNAPLHVDDAAARALGLPGSIVQGMCLLAVAFDTAAEALGFADLRLRSIRARFARPVRPGIALTTRGREIRGTDGAARYAFETVDDAGKTILKHGVFTR